MAEDWTSFYEQAIRDQTSSKILFQNEDFGNSAYHLQQCIEKYVKAVILKHKLYNNPQKLGHLPLRFLWKELRKIHGATLKHSRNPRVAKWQHQFLQITDPIQAFYDSVPHDLKIVIWKWSLEIPISEEEKTKIASEKEKLEKIRPLCIEMGRDYDYQFQELLQKIKQLPIKKRRQFEDFIKFIRQYFKFYKLEDESLSPQEIFTIQTPSNIATTLEKFNKLNPRDKSGISKERLVLVLLVSWVFTFYDIILRTFTHESIGRYPITIDGESSNNLYKQHKDALLRLSTKVDVACKRLDEMLHNS